MDKHRCHYRVLLHRKKNAWNPVWFRTGLLFSTCMAISESLKRDMSGFYLLHQWGPFLVNSASKILDPSATAWSGSNGASCTFYWEEGKSMEKISATKRPPTKCIIFRVKSKPPKHPFYTHRNCYLFPIILQHPRWMTWPPHPNQEKGSHRKMECPWFPSFHHSSNASNALVGLTACEENGIHTFWSTICLQKFTPLSEVLSTAGAKMSTQIKLWCLFGSVTQQGVSGIQQQHFLSAKGSCTPTSGSPGSSAMICDTTWKREIPLNLCLSNPAGIKPS